MPATIQELKEKRGELLAEASVCLEPEEDGEVSQEMEARAAEIVDKLVPNLESDIKKLEVIEQRKKKVALALAQLQKPANGASLERTPGESPLRLPRLVAPRLTAFRGDGAIENAYRCGMWLRAVTLGDDKAKSVVDQAGWQIRNVATEGSDPAGGYIVPDPLSTAIIDVMDLYGVARRICRVVTMTSDTYKIPKRTGGLTVYYPGEATAITLSDKSWGQVALTAVKRTTLSKISTELRDDAVINVVDDLAMEIGRAIGIQLDNELCNGDGTSAYGAVTGLRSAVGAAGTKTSDTGDSTWEGLDLDDLIACVAGLGEKYHPTASWLMSRAFFHSVIERLVISQGGSTGAELSAGGSRRQFMGYPIDFSDRMPTATATSTIHALFGSFRDAVILGERQGIEIATSDQYAFNEDVITIRGTYRCDIVVHEPGDASTAGAYVALKTAAS